MSSFMLLTAPYFHGPGVAGGPLRRIENQQTPVAVSEVGVWPIPVADRLDERLERKPEGRLARSKQQAAHSSGQLSEVP